MSTKIQLCSLGFLAQRLQHSPAAIREAARRANIAPAMTLNGIEHWEENRIPEIRQELDRRRLIQRARGVSVASLVGND